MTQVNEFWGKAQPVDGQSPDWHPLPFHCLDVAAVAKTILQLHDASFLSYFSRSLSLSPSTTCSLLTYLVALHDLGKFARQFQAKVPAHFPQSVFHQDASNISTSYDHATGGFALFSHEREELSPKGVRWRDWKYLVSSTTGHHGRPPQYVAVDSRSQLLSWFGKPGIESATEFAHLAATTIGSPTDLKDFDTTYVRAVSFLLSGLTVLSDWLGSNTTWFQYRSSDDFSNLNEYWNYAQHQAKIAVRQAGIEPTPILADLTYEDLIGVNAEPTPMQRWARDSLLPKGPSLFIVEDETGSGKTEAALMLACRLINAHNEHGIYIALPTMATANAMFDRLMRSHRNIYARHHSPSITLVHGAREIYQAFRDVEIPRSNTESSYDASSDDESDRTATTNCSEWLNDENRRAFFADLGAGTIDQALLSILHSRFHSLRMFGLSRKILILDEIHAYDAYMKVEIEQLLQFHAAFGGSAILLSATLPVDIKNKLIAAYARGTELDKTATQRARLQELNTATEYPSVTVYSKEGLSFEGIEPRTDVSRSLPVRLVHSTNEALNYAVLNAKKGRAVIYIRNTVDDVIRTSLAAQRCGVQPTVFHARFILADRFDLEREVVSRWGKTGKSADREGLLIATQVVEQSLDLDFDVMVTDLAPMDLIVQRAGRLWRHERQRELKSPELLVVTPKPIQSVNGNWYEEMFPTGAYVYRKHGVLWRTAFVLDRLREIKSPQGLRNLVESAYSMEKGPATPQSLENRDLEEEGREGADQSIAKMMSMNISDGYLDDGDVWQSDERVRTRIDDVRRRTLRLCYQENGALIPLAKRKFPDESNDVLWRLSEVNINERTVNAEEIPGPFDSLAQKTRNQSGWGKFDQQKILVIMTQDAENNWEGLAKSDVGESESIVRVRYSNARGLTTENTSIEDRKNRC